jgi:hypothetical protein
MSWFSPSEMGSDAGMQFREILDPAYNIRRRRFSGILCGILRVLHLFRPYLLISVWEYLSLQNVT